MKKLCLTHNSDLSDTKEGKSDAHATLRGGKMEEQVSISEMLSELPFSVHLEDSQVLSGEQGNEGTSAGSSSTTTARATFAGSSTGKQMLKVKLHVKSRLQ